MSETFQNILTITGQQKKAAAEAGGEPVNITYFKVGDSSGTYYTPLETQTDLVNPTYTGYFGAESQIIVNPAALNEVLYKCFIPADVGGFTVRELGLFDAEDDLILICKLPAQDKFALDAGLYQPLTFTPKIIYTNPAEQAVLTPSSQIIATQTFVNEQINEGIASHDDDSNAHNSLFTGLQNTVSEIPTFAHVSYSVNYGNRDANGYADLIEKVSDTEVSFKVGGTYHNMGITFPNGKHREISSIPNITGLNDDALYTFVIFEENLIKLEDGTYSAIATAAKLGYDAVQRIPALTSGSHDGYTATYSGSLGFDPYNIFDNDAGTAASYNQSVYILDPANFRPEPSGYSTFVIAMDTTKNIEYLVINSDSYFQPGWFNWDGYQVKIQTSTDGGSTWSAESTVDLTSPQTKIDILQDINAIKFQFSFCTSAYSDSGMNNYWYVRKYLNVTDIDIYERITYPGGAVTEDIKLPETYDASIVPAMTSNSSGGWTASANDEATGAETYKAFDGSFENNNRWYTGVNNVGWLKIAKDSGTFNISRIAITAPEDSTYTSTPKNFTIKDQADNVLANFTDQIYAPNETKYFDVAATDISAVKIDVTQTNGGSGITAKEVKLYTTVTSAAGDLHLFISQKPLKPCLRQASSWVEKQFVKAGEVTKISGTLGTPVNYAFNGLAFINQTVTKSNTYSIAHNIGSARINLFGYYNNISGALNLTNGTNGYSILSSASGSNEGTSLVCVDKLTFNVIASNDYIWRCYLPNTNLARFTTADAAIYVRRAF